jgi:hypothetical protein
MRTAGLGQNALRGAGWGRVRSMACGGRDMLAAPERFSNRTGLRRYIDPYDV